MPLKLVVPFNFLINFDNHVLDHRYFEIGCDLKDVFFSFVSEDIVGVHCTHGVNRSGYLVCRLVYFII